MLVVSHSAFMKRAVTGRDFANADFRIFEFRERGGDDEPYALEEWEETRTSGGGMGWSASGVCELGVELPLP